MVGLVFTLDMEVYGTGAGDPEALMLAPTERLLAVMDRYGARATIMAEVAEILAFRRQAELRPLAIRIEELLRSAVARGHDVQLHLHPAWFNARYERGRWRLDSSEYALVGLPPERIAEYLRRGKEYLEELLKPVRPAYRCVAFRAGNWLVQPSREVVRALERCGFRYDTSVFKHGWGSVGPYVLDYRSAHDELLPWRVDPDDINRSSSRAGLWEVPIFSRRVFLPSLLTPRRVSMQRGLEQRIAAAGEGEAIPALGTGRRTSRLRLFPPKKFDFCRMTFREMRDYLHRALARCGSGGATVPVVAIGHSTELLDMAPLRRFLEYVGSACRGSVGWTTFRECPLGRGEAVA
jgi:hypothetical protein